MKIKDKIKKLFIAISLIATAGNIISIACMQHEVNSYSNVIKYYGIAQGKTGQIGIDVQEERLLIMKLIDSTNDEERSNLEAKIMEVSDQIDEEFKDLGSYIHDEDFNVIYNDIGKNIVAYNEQREKTIENSKISKAMALKTFNNGCAPIANTIHDEIYNLLEKQVERVSESEQRISSINRIIVISLLCITALIFVFGIIAGNSVGNKIAYPISQFADAIGQMQSGIFDASKVTYEDDSELGELADIFREFSGKMGVLITSISSAIEKYSHGDFTYVLSDEEVYYGDFKDIYKSLTGLQSRLHRSVVELIESTKSVEMNAEQISAGASVLADGAIEQASSVEEIAGDISHVSNSISDISKYSKISYESVDDVGECIQSSVAKMNELNESINGVSSKSDEIKTIIKIIQDIAFQTNILALNAAVEAAHAGEAGKGFDVVAEEVRNLAQKSNECAKQTGELITSVIEELDRTNKLAAETKTMFNVVLEKGNAIKDESSNISNEIAKQSEHINHVANEINTVSSIVQTNSATAEEAASASHELFDQSNKLAKTVAYFKV